MEETKVIKVLLLSSQEIVVSEIEEVAVEAAEEVADDIQGAE